MMGGGPDKEHLLIALWDPEPVHITSEIKRRFPHIEVTYVQLPPLGENPFKDAHKTNTVPSGE
jgi:hypothetical protein